MKSGERYPIVKRNVLGKEKVRKGRGFSLKEIRESGLGLDLARRIGLYIDYRRRSSHQENVEYLKRLASSLKGEKIAKDKEDS